MIKLGIRVANSITDGRGHFERCFSISNYFNSKIIWFLDEKNEMHESKIKNKDEIIYEKDISKVSLMAKAVYEGKVNIVLLDSYNIDINYISKLFTNVPLCVFQDTNKLLNVEMIICPHPIEIETNNNTIKLCGPSFAPISGNLLYNKVSKTNNDINLLISMGSYDSLGITINIIKAIKNLSKNLKNKIKTRIILGEESPIIDEIQNLIKGDLSYDLCVNVKDMTEIYTNASIAIGAPGLSHMERLYFGIPTVLISQNSIHESIVDKWVNLGCAVKSKNDINKIEKKIIYIIEDINIRNNLIKNGRNLVDGKGALRIAKAMLNLV